jgi:hypothetical protein
LVAGWKYVYAIRGGNEIIGVQATTPNEIVSVVALAGNVARSDAATVSPDGRQIILSIEEEKSDVWLMENFDPSAQARRPQ